ncbi:carotenoid 1,2-hydratase [Gordonia sp. VNQ95]|uniref:carotenoid 1,2-hydratase n=1 Tax=Gordonia sp. VNQ95 TaxID=3156619 RepID=UPI0032B3BF8A
MSFKAFRRLLTSAAVLVTGTACALTIGAPAHAFPPVPDFPQVFTPPGPVTFPRDESPHHQQLEWWYFVGHLYGTDAHGAKREFGYEATVFQLWPLPVGSDAIYSWHFAITDVNKQKFRVEDRANLTPIPARNGGFGFTAQDWTLGGSNQNYHIKAAMADRGYAVDLHTSSSIPFVVHNGNGLVDYKAVGNTSAYYSSTDLDTTGTLWDHGEPIRITGSSWQDRQWFNKTQMLGGGWNWFSLQLGNNTQYMLYYLTDPSTGAVINKIGTKVVNGVPTTVPGDQMGMTVLGSQRSPSSGFTYPTKWRLTVPSGTFQVTPLVPHQELTVPLHRTYLEAASSVTGRLDGQPVSGRAYAEVNPWEEPYTSLP